MGERTTRTVEVDENTDRLLDMLQEKMSMEPMLPEVDLHIGAQFTEIARIHEQWQREIDALRLLCGVRLVNRALHG